MGLKPTPMLCERIVLNGKMWCASHNRLHSECTSTDTKMAVPSCPVPKSLELSGKVLALGAKRAYTPSDGEN